MIIVISCSIIAALFIFILLYKITIQLIAIMKGKKLFSDKVYDRQNGIIVVIWSDEYGIEREKKFRVFKSALFPKTYKPIQTITIYSYKNFVSCGKLTIIGEIDISILIILALLLAIFICS